MLLGEYSHTIDTKGRLIIPAKFRGDLGERFIITRGLDGCVFGYPMKAWHELEDKLQELPLAKRESRTITRFFYSAATECSIDKQGRINIPDTLRQYADLKKACAVVGVSSRFEIWNNERWESYAKEAGEDFDALAEDMLDFGF